MRQNESVHNDYEPEHRTCYPLKHILMPQTANSVTYLTFCIDILLEFHFRKPTGNECQNTIKLTKHITIQTSPADSHQDGDCFGAVTMTAFHAALRSLHWPHVIHLNADGHLLLANGK